MNCVSHQSSGMWRHPDDQSHNYKSLKHWLELARTMERGLFDGVFLADVAGVYDVYGDSPDAAIAAGMQFPANDPFSLISGMAAVTEHLCFGVTGSIPYEPPYAFARRLSTLDHLTDGRMGWNIVTGYLDSAARAAGQAKQQSHDVRYDIAADYMEVVYKLWEGSWADDALVIDPVGGIFTDPNKIRRINHQGAYFQIDAIHLCEPSPQRTPVLFQAGASPRGQAFAGRHAECVFIGAPDRSHAATTVKSLRQRAVAAGRRSEDVKVFQLACVIVDDTDTAAQDKHDALQTLGIGAGSLALMSGWSGIDLSRLNLTESAIEVSTEAIQSASRVLGSRTVGEWSEFLTLGGASPVFVGSAATVVDQMEAWLDEADLDGFNLAHTLLPSSLEDFVDKVVPEMQSRGRYKEAYAEGSMRHKLFGRGDKLPEVHPAAAFRVA